MYGNGSRESWVGRAISTLATLLNTFNTVNKYPMGSLNKAVSQIVACNAITAF